MSLTTLEKIAELDEQIVQLARRNKRREPTEAQKKAGNYKKGHLYRHGMRISIENRRGTFRSGKDKYGNPWRNRMYSDYGYIRRTLGADGDHVDVHVGSSRRSETVYVIDQVDKNGRFDEHKVMLGYTSLSQAKRAYLKNYPKGWRMGKITPVTIWEFKHWLNNGNKRRPFASRGVYRVQFESVEETTDLGIRQRVRQYVRDATGKSVRGLDELEKSAGRQVIKTKATLQEARKKATLATEKAGGLDKRHNRLMRENKTGVKRGTKRKVSKRRVRRKLTDGKNVRARAEAESLTRKARQQEKPYQTASSELDKIRAMKKNAEYRMRRNRRQVKKAVVTAASLGGLGTLSYAAHRAASS